MFLAGEWGRSASLDDETTDPTASIPATSRFYRAVNEALEQRNIGRTVNHLEHWLSQSGRFERITSREFKMPIGDWPEDTHRRALGIQFRDILRLYADSMRVMLVEGGWNSWDVEALIRGFVHEIYTVSGMVCVFKVVHARRVHVDRIRVV